MLHRLGPFAVPRRYQITTLLDMSRVRRNDDIRQTQKTPFENPRHLEAVKCRALTFCRIRNSALWSLFVPRAPKMIAFISVAMKREARYPLNEAPGPQILLAVEAKNLGYPRRLVDQNSADVNGR